MGTLKTIIQNAQINTQISYADKELLETTKISNFSFNDICHGIFDRNFIKDPGIFEIFGFYNTTLRLVRERDTIELIQDIIAVLLILAVRYFLFIFPRYFVPKLGFRRRQRSGMYLLNFSLE